MTEKNILYAKGNFGKSSPNNSRRVQMSNTTENSF